MVIGALSKSPGGGSGEIVFLPPREKSWGAPGLQGPTLLHALHGG